MSIEVKNLKIKVIINGAKTDKSEANNRGWNSRQVVEAIQKVNKNRKER